MARGYPFSKLKVQGTHSILIRASSEKEAVLIFNNDYPHSKLVRVYKSEEEKDSFRVSFNKRKFMHRKHIHGFIGGKE